MKRIAFYLPQLEAGDGHAVLRLARELTRREFEITIVANRADGALAAAFASDFPVTALDTSATALAGGALARAMRALSPDVLAPVSTAAILCAAALKRFGRIKCALVGWQREAIVAPHDSTLAARAQARLARMLFRSCDAMAFASQGAAREAMSLAKVAGGIVIVGPAPEAASGALTAHAQALLAAARGPRIVSLGRLSRREDQLTLMRAFQSVSRTAGGSLLLIGGGPQRAALEAAAVGLGLGDKVMFAGEMADPGALIGACDLFVSCARGDDAGDGVLEALAQGLPIIAPDGAATRELLADNRFGALVPAGDARALAQAIREASSTTHDKSAQRARASEFSSAAAADAFVEAISANRMRRAELTASEGADRKAA